ncbi:MAG: PDZ domain-containing protein [Candidatus Melainabacteria bacterium]|nr:PDZ domain-containing protein [Candidatus Melainabacteria bacterium]
MRDDSDEQSATVQIEEGPQPIRQVVINTYTMRANLPNTVISDPFTLMRALLGSRSQDYEKLYAERDTGYGVCGFLMNMPVTQRGYALVLKCFPSMPAAEANLQPGDLITSVNGQSTLDLPPREVWDWFTGMPGTEVKIDVLRGRQPISVTLKRMDIGHIPDFATRAEFLTLFKHNGMSKFVQK